MIPPYIGQAFEHLIGHVVEIYIQNGCWATGIVQGVSSGVVVIADEHTGRQQAVAVPGICLVKLVDTNVDLTEWKPKPKAVEVPDLDVDSDRLDR